ncbi:hypothetical protein ACGFK1_13220 [Mycobacterium sp. NPDC048908]|uniref:hypothetical protein n=1 Tax=Mycobacterium sp. NPDC048908 TaxID=3364292 RepID=UPI00371F7AF7
MTADRAADILRQIRPRGSAAKTLRSLAADLFAEIRAVDRRITKAAADVTTAVESSRTTLTELSGIGTLQRRQDLGPRRGRPAIPLGRCIRLLHRHRTHCSFLW